MYVSRAGLQASLRASRIPGALLLGATAYWLQAAYHARIPPSHLLAPLLWMLTAMIVYPMVFRDPRGSLILHASIIAAGTITAAWMMQGFLTGFALSPYSHDALGIALNLYRVVPTILGIEALRTILARRLAVKRGFEGLELRTPGFILTALLFTLPQFTLSQMSLGFGGDAVYFLSSRLIPGIAKSIMLTMMAASTGFTAPAVSSLTLGLSEILTPVMPHIPRVFAGIAWTLIYMVGLGVFLALTGPRGKPLRSTNPRGLAMLAMLSIAILAPTGIFGYRASVVMSSSMEPAINVGDIVIVKLGEQPENGSIAEFSHEGMLIVHRIVGVKVSKEGARTYITKGDAVREPDPFKTNENMIVGTVKARIPKLGWINIAMRKALTTLMKHMTMLNISAA